MGRPATFNDPVRQIVQTSEDQHKYDTPTFRRLQITAGQPLNMMVTPNYKEQAGLLSTALAESIPSLITASTLMAAKAQKGEEEAGGNARVAEIGLDPEKSDQLGFFASSGFKKGYYQAYGIEKGQVAKEQLQADWDADPNRNDVTTDEWTRNWYKKNTEGMNGYALAGFNKEVTPSLLKLAQQGAIEKIDDVEASVYQQRFNILTSDWKSGTWTPEQAKKRQEELGLSNTDFDKLQVRALTQFANDGENPEAARQALKVMSMDRPDGTPGITFKNNIVKSGWAAEMAQTIETASQARTRLQEQTDSQARTQEQLDLKDKLLSMAYDSGNPAGATAYLQKIRKQNPGLVNVGLANSLQKQINEYAENKKRGTGGSGEGGAYSPLVLKLAKGLDSGEVDVAEVWQHVDNGSLSRQGLAQVRELTGGLRSLRKGIFKTDAYEAAEAELGVFRPGKSEIDLDGTTARNFRDLNNRNNIDLKRRVQNGEDPVAVAKELRKRSEMLVESGVLRNGAYDFDSKAPAATSTPTGSTYKGITESQFTTYEDFYAAWKNNRISGVTLEAEKKFWQNKLNVANKGDRK